MQSKITNDDEMIQWAKEIVAAKGTKFIPLTKTEFFYIASWICKQLKIDVPATPGGEAPAQDIPHPRNDMIDALPPLKTRAEKLHEEGVLPQDAYDMYLSYCRKNKITPSVMDFSNGKRSTGAPFAYWLAQKIMD